MKKIERWFIFQVGEDGTLYLTKDKTWSPFREEVKLMDEAEASDLASDLKESEFTRNGCGSMMVWLTIVDEIGYFLTFDKWCYAWNLTCDKIEKDGKVRLEVYDEDQPFGNVYAEHETEKGARELLLEKYGRLPEWWCEESEEEYRESLWEEEMWTDPAGGVHYHNEDDPAKQYE